MLSVPSLPTTAFAPASPVRLSAPVVPLVEPETKRAILFARGELGSVSAGQSGSAVIAVSLSAWSSALSVSQLLVFV
jgi:hypothetical protein